MVTMGRLVEWLLAQPPVLKPSAALEIAHTAGRPETWGLHSPPELLTRPGEGAAEGFLSIDEPAGTVPTLMPIAVAPPPPRSPRGSAAGKVRGRPPWRPRATSNQSVPERGLRHLTRAVFAIAIFLVVVVAGLSVLTTSRQHLPGTGNGEPATAAPAPPGPIHTVWSCGSGSARAVQVSWDASPTPNVSYLLETASSPDGPWRFQNGHAYGFALFAVPAGGQLWIRVTAQMVADGRVLSSAPVSRHVRAPKSC